MKIVECVPNFSEGRDPAVIKSITDEIERVQGVRLLDVDPGADTHRTVVTFVGSPEATREAAFRAIRRAAELIDMSRHHGAHARMGATDVCPFVPVSGVTMEECAALARALGERVARELGIPVFLYEEAATRPERRNLATIRQGEYEGLADKLKDPAWRPDFGEPVFNPRSGATVIGAREFLIAYNVNLNTRDARIANAIAGVVRESGRPERDAAGALVKDAQGQKVMIPGILKGVKASGWAIAKYGLAQVTMNVTSYKVTPVHQAFEAVAAEAARLGVRVVGSEIVGVVPKQALLEAGRYFLEKQGKSAGQPEEEVLHIADLSLGLGTVAPFDPRKKVIEYLVEEPRPLVARTVRSFVDELSVDSPVPGGGSVAALCGALGAALASMVANLTVGKKGYDAQGAEMKALAVEAQELKDALLAAVDDDARSFERVMEANRLPKASDEEKAARRRAIDEATLGAAAVPMSVLRRAERVVALARTVAERGFKPSLSDSGVAALAARAGAEGAYYNVVINLAGVPALPEAAATRAEADAVLARVTEAAAEVARLVRARLEQG